MNQHIDYKYLKQLIVNENWKLILESKNSDKSTPLFIELMEKCITISKIPKIKKLTMDNGRIYHFHEKQRHIKNKF